jgi:NmrA-like family
VRGVTRSATSDSAKAQAAKGISIVEADLDKPSSLIPAFSGAHVVFAVTDFWAPFWESNARLSKISDRATGEHAYAIEVQRGKNVVDAVHQVLKEGGTLERFVLSTLPGFKEQSKGKYTYVYHFDSKAEITEYLKSKDELWERSSLLNMTFYSSNIVRFWQLTKASQPAILSGVWLIVDAAA